MKAAEYARHTLYLEKGTLVESQGDGGCARSAAVKYLASDLGGSVSAQGAHDLYPAVGRSSVPAVWIARFGAQWFRDRRASGS